MDTTSGIKIGQVVKSKLGRDKDKVFTVVEILQEDYVLIADGVSRKIENPKKKKIKHLSVYNSILNDLSKKIANNEIDNSYIKKELAPFNE